MDRSPSKMDMETVLDHVIFQLTPTRTRFELFVVASGVTERVASGLLKPFILHLQAAEEQLSKGGCSIKLEPSHKRAPWFTKGTAERFVRFVNSPEVIERGSSIDMELVQLEETIQMQTLNSSRVESPLSEDSSTICIIGDQGLSSYGEPRLLKKMRQDSNGNDSGAGTNSKKQLLRALEARRLVLQKEQGMAFARAAAAGFELLHLLQLIMFADCFGASRLREACCNFVRLCKKAKIYGFCMGELNLIDQDLSWALSNTVCMSILESMQRAKPLYSRGVEEDAAPARTGIDSCVSKDAKISGDVGFDHPVIDSHYQQQMPLPQANLSPSGQFCEWPNSTDICQGWPAMYADMHGQYATYYGNNYGYGYTPGSQESFTTLSDMSPSGPPGVFYSSEVIGQQCVDAQSQFKLHSSMDLNFYPSLKKLQFGHRGAKKSIRVSQGVRSKNALPDGYEKCSSKMSDSLSEKSDSLSTASVDLLDGDASRVSGTGGHLGQEFARAEIRKKANSVALKELKVASKVTELSDVRMNTTVSSCWAPSPGDSATIHLKNKDRVCLDGSSFLHQTSGDITNVQETQRTDPDDNSVVLFEQFSEGSLASRSKKRLDFEEPKMLNKQKHTKEVITVDDSFMLSSPCFNGEHRGKPAIESEIQGNQIYSKMSKQALKVNSLVSNQCDADDLLMLPRKLKNNSAGMSNDVLNIDIKLLDPAQYESLLNSQKGMMCPGPSQERVRKFLDQYNEKREAKLRGDVNSSKRAEQDRKLKADLDKRKSDLFQSQRPERASLQAEARLRAEKVRMLKADLQKSKKEKEEEERCRLEGLKAQRQARIAARSNLAGRSSTGLSTSRGPMSLQKPSTSKPSSAPSRLLNLQNNSRAVLQASKPRPAPSRSSTLQKSRSILQASTSMQVARSSKENGSWSSSRPALHQQPRSSTTSLARQCERASIGSQPSEKVGILKGPQRCTSPPIRTNRMFSAMFDKDAQLGRSSFRGNTASSTMASKKRVTGAGSSTLLEESKKEPPPKSGREMPKNVKEPNLEGRTFLKKGSGTGTSNRSVRKPKLTSPSKAKLPVEAGGVDAPLVCADRSRSSSPLTTYSELWMDPMGLDRKKVCEVKEPNGLVFWDKKSLSPRSLVTKGRAIELTDTCLPGTRALVETYWQPEGLKSVPRFSDGVSPLPPSVSTTDSRQSSSKQQLNSLQMMSSLVLMTTASTKSESLNTGGRAVVGRRLYGKTKLKQPHGQRVSSNGLKEPWQTSKVPVAAAVHDEGEHLSQAKGSTTKVTRPFSFFGTLRSKAAQTKWR